MKENENVYENLMEFVSRKFEWKANADFEPYYEIYIAYSEFLIDNPKYYYTILNNKWKNSLKRKDNTHSDLEGVDAPYIEQSKFDMKDVYVELNERQIKIVDLALDGLGQEEISEALNVSLRTIKREYSEIKYRLKHVL